MYNIERFKQDIRTVEPRVFDKYILPPFMMAYAYKSKSMSKTARRALFVAGIFMFYRNAIQYRELLNTITSRVGKISDTTKNS